MLIITNKNQRVNIFVKYNLQFLIFYVFVKYNLQTRKADYNLQKSRLQTQLEVKYRGDDGFNITVLNTLKILSKAKDIFTATTRSLTDKQMLLRLLFKQIVLQEGIITCIPNQPFSFILGENKLRSITKDTIAKNESTELQCTKGLEADFEGSTDSLSEKPLKPYKSPHNTLIYKEKNCSEKQFIKSGWSGRIRTYECRHQKPMPYHLATLQS